jgi:hypothetical protein
MLPTEEECHFFVSHVNKNRKSFHLRVCRVIPSNTIIEQICSKPRK